MDWVYFHLVINHFPIVGAIIGTMLLVSGMVFRNQGVRMSGLGTIVFAAFMAIVAYMSGDPAANVMSGLPETIRSLVSRHENIATIGMYLIVTAGLLAASTLYSIWKKDKSIGFLIILTLAFSLISAGTMVYIGRTGGQIRHSEIRNEATRQYIIEHQNDTGNNE